MSASIAFRTDASAAIGTGHVMRCLTLAEALRADGADCRFLCRAHPGHLGERIAAAGFPVDLLPVSEDRAFAVDDAYASWLGATWQDDATQTNALLAGRGVDAVVVDHYALDARWESALRPRARVVVAIDDLAERAHACDVLLDQNLGRVPADYAGKVPANAELLLGTRFALLRPEFAAMRPSSLARRRGGPLRQLLVTMGGVDAGNATGRALDALALCQLPGNCRIMVVMGSRSPWLHDIERRKDRLPFSCELRVDATDMASLMADSDLCLGAVGGTAWERCCLGLPTIALVTAENQRDGANRLAQAGAIALLDDADAMATELPRMLVQMQAEGRLATMASVAAGLVDGEGAGRVAAALRERWT